MKKQSWVRRAAIGLAAGLVGVAVAVVPTHPATAADPALTVTPSHKDLVPGQVWENDIPFTTTKVMPKLDLVLVIDRTGSMSSQIRWVADGLGDIVSGLQGAGAADIQLSIVSYGDLDDGRDATKIEMPLGVHSTADARATLNTIANSVWGGGDTPEDSIYALEHGVVDTPWRADAQHNMILVTDAEAKIRPSVTVGGQPVTVNGLSTLMTASNVQATLLATTANSGAGSTIGIAELANGIGGTYALTPNKTSLVDAAVIGIKDTPVQWTLGHTVSCVYESDGAPSTDVTLTVDPTQSIVNGGDSGVFHERAVAKAKFDRANDATVCTLQMTINGVSAGAAASQTVRAIWTPAEIALTILDGDGNAAATEDDAQDIDPAGDPVTFTVTNTGQAILDSVFLVGAAVDGQLSTLVCDRDITVAPSGVTLNPGDIVICTATIVADTAGVKSQVTGTVTGEARNSDVASVSANAEYWVMTPVVAPVVVPPSVPAAPEQVIAAAATVLALASTGSDVVLPLAGAVLLAGLGVLVVVLVRRRQATA